MGSKHGVFIRNIKLGGGAPVSVQSMTNTDTRDIDATIGQINRLTAAGCEIVRISVYDDDCAKAIPAIKSKTNVPLVADIHFDYRLAIKSIDNGIDKLRFNPGNIGSTAKVRELISCAKSNNIPIRIGVNGGSLEKDLLNKYGGPTPEAMVESALSHVLILENEGFEAIVISLKASSVLDTISAYRNVAAKVDYPLHIGVTEAGMRSAGLIKSAIGIGVLLNEGIGDTLRVSLTGDPEQEVYAGIEILKALDLKHGGIEIISCPTCGRCSVNLESVVDQVENALKGMGGRLKLAVMGCAVNGPGEAKEADIGIAFGDCNAAVFQKGKLFYVEALPGAVNRFIDDCKKLILEQESKQA